MMNLAETPYAGRRVDLTSLPEIEPKSMSARLMGIVEKLFSATERPTITDVKKMFLDVMYTDNLTQTRNKLYYDDNLHNEALDNPARAVMVVDLDFFKDVNDFYGHAVGNHVLRTFGLVLRETSEKYGCRVARWGGEEFAVVSPEVSDPVDRVELLVKVLGETRAKLKDKDFVVKDIRTRKTNTFKVDCSGGIGDNFKTADTALYLRKSAGRGGVAVNFESISGLVPEDFPPEYRPSPPPQQDRTNRLVHDVLDT